MKKAYVKPALEIDRYTLSASIASNCADVINSGPAVGTESACSDWEQRFPTTFTTFSNPHNVNFYDAGTESTTVCDCYHSAGGDGFWTS